MSSAQAQKFHSITIGDKNTWDDWHLVPTSRPLVNPPSVQTSYAELIAADGQLDLTESLSNSVIYGNRSGSWEFLVINPGQIASETDYTLYPAIYSDILNYLHGQEFHVMLDDDPDYYYNGRLAVGSWTSKKGNSIITINYNFEPYKTNITSGGQRF